MVRNRTAAARGFRGAALLLALLPAARFCYSQPAPGELMKQFTFDDPKYGSIVVAEVGRKTITAQEFLFSYEFGPAFPRREKDSRRRYLTFMTYEKLLAMAGYEQGLDRSGDARKSLAEVEGDLATDELFKADVRSKVRVPESEISRGARLDETGLAVRWLYAPVRRGIDSLAQLLARGIPFDTLYAVQTRDSAMRDERSMETTPFRLGLKNPQLATVIDTLAVRAPSSPVPAPDGYYIMFVKDKWTNALPNQSDQVRRRSDVERALVEHESDSLSDRYIRQMMEGANPVIERKPFDILETHLAEIVLGPEKFSAWGLAGRLRQRWGQANYEDLNLIGTESLVTLSGRSFSVNEYLDWYHARETGVRFAAASPQAFFLSLEQTVWRMVRDRLLVERALARGFQNRSTVKRQVQWWKDKIVYNLVRRQIADSIRLTDAMLRDYFAAHRRDYRSTGGDTVSFERAKDDVQKDCYTFELTKRLLHRLAALRQKYGVTIRDKGLGKLPVDDEFDPRAIDIYAVKNGGTFPRPAFPSIDYEWQTWQ